MNKHVEEIRAKANRGEKITADENLFVLKWVSREMEKRNPEKFRAARAVVRRRMKAWRKLVAIGQTLTER